MPDVVAVSTRQDRSTISKAFMGSTSSAVARSCPTVTLLVRSRAGPGSPAAGAELPAGYRTHSAPAPNAPSKVTEGAALAVTATLAAAAARAAAKEAEKRVAAEVAEASGGDERAEKARKLYPPHAARQQRPRLCHRYYQSILSFNLSQEAAIKAVEAMQQEKVLEKKMMAQVRTDPFFPVLLLAFFFVLRRTEGSSITIH
jgi:hypothetical protein